MDEMFGKLEKDKEVYILEPKDYVGAVPIRQDITVIPADNTTELRLGWVIHEELGPCYDLINNMVHDFNYNVSIPMEEYPLFVAVKAKEDCENKIEALLNSKEIRQFSEQSLLEADYRLSGNDQYDLITQMDLWYSKLEAIEYEQVISKRRTVK